MPKAREMNPTDPSLLDQFWRLMQNDLNCHDQEMREFPLSTMSRLLADQIVSILPLLAEARPDSRLRSLDVGTGTGVHALLMAASGFRKIDAIDVSVEAIERAQERHDRLSARIHLWNRDYGLTFRAIGLDEYFTDSQQAKYDLITFNPPAFYPIAHGTHRPPSYQGVYVDDRSDTFSDPSNSLLTRFFRLIVVPRLSAKGHVICTWPGLERRLVQRNSDKLDTNRLEHPLNLLADWLKIKCATKRRDPNEFYSHVAVISDYGLGDGFWRNLSLGYEKGLYSRLFNYADPKHGFKQTFRLGILHLRRRDEDGLDFDFIPPVTPSSH